MNISDYFVNFAQKMIMGNAAVVVQSYGEVNSKKGTSFELSALFEGTVKGTPIMAIFITGNLPVTIKDRSFGYTGTAIRADIYKNPTYTGGTASTEIKNTNDINPEETTVTIIQGATITDVGTKLASTAYLLGGTRNQSKGNASSAITSEYALAPNSVYVLSTESLDDTVQDIAVHNGWYEGETDFPIKEA